MTKILSIGSGALGCFYSGILSRNKDVEITLFCRSDYNKLKENPQIHINSYQGDFTFSPHKIVNDLESINSEKFDFIIVMTKAIPSLDLKKLLRPVVKENTAIVILQNGIDNEEELIKHFPNNEIIAGLAFIACQRISTGKILHQDFGKIKLGSTNGKISENMILLQALLQNGGVECEVVDNHRYIRWMKLIWNCAFNPLSAILNGADTSFILQDPVCKKLCTDIMHEIFAIAEKDGHILPPELIEQNITSTMSMKPYKTSMCLDYENKREMEVEIMVGNVVRIANRLDVPAPKLETIYAILKQLNIKNIS